MEDGQFELSVDDSFDFGYDVVEDRVKIVINND